MSDRVTPVSAASRYTVASALGLKLRILPTDGSQPVGRGIGPALEARDVLAVLQNAPHAPQDLRKRALTLAAADGRENVSAWKLIAEIEQARGNAAAAAAAQANVARLTP